MGRKKIMIIEDDLFSQLVYKGILSKDYDLTICGDDKAFDVALSQENYDLFIIDLALNCETDGIDLIKELRLMVKYRDSTIIVVTAHAFRKDRELAMDAGANKFITKPFNVKYFIEEIHKYF